MPFIPFVGVAKAVIGQSIAGQPVSNILWFAKDGYTFADQQILAGVLWTSWATNIMPLLAVEALLERVQVYDMTSETGAIATQTAAAVAGGSTGDQLPRQDAIVYTFRTAGRGRSARGRMYLSGATEELIADGVIPPASIATLEGALADVFADAALEGWTHVVAQQYAEGLPLSQGFARPVTAIEIRSGLLGTQRRRSGRP